ncbi:hypothetical protein GCM10029976_093270 [Kribbella albertanoniae]|uniref:Major facilitator superfamily (MFS) profile domain-containing protein n=1 Tax=Kribbella albertanoniae TaxID=1266829 RepID=A0A4R4Q254_9ACTN|nr:hypothetical protein [Kribbella albertanoniae]TDC29047.1 hypothetical protein E1261_16760 [Kribbella albertanoniae]
MSGIYKAGLVILGLVSVADLSTPLLSDGEHPPMAVAIGAAVAGLISLVLIALGWQGKRWVLAPLIALRLASALLAVPAFFVADVPAAGVAAAGVGVAATIFGVIAVLMPARTPVRV